jgi:hypothetical protein
MQGRMEGIEGKFGESIVLPSEYTQFVSPSTSLCWMPEGCVHYWPGNKLCFLLGLPWNKGSTKQKFLTTTKFAKPTQAN